MKICPDCGYFNEEKHDEYSPYPGECEDCYRYEVCLNADKEESDMTPKEKNNELIIYIPKDGHYIDILGHRIYRNGRWDENSEAEDSWIAFLEYLHDCEEAMKENELLKSKLKQIDQPPEWLYHTLFECHSLVDFDTVEKALGFRLFSWQKDYIVRGGIYADRRTGKTTAQILHELLNLKGEPIDFSEPPLNRRAAIARQDCRDIWEKLHDAGIEMRPVFWGKADKSKFECVIDPYKYAREAFEKYEADNPNYTCSDCSQCRYDEGNGIYYCRRSYTMMDKPELRSACDDFEKGE